MARFEKLVAITAEGWCRWVSPIHGKGKRNYKMACCDCGLVHDMQFRVVKERSGRLSVLFRARRNNRSTAAMRRDKKSYMTMFPRNGGPAINAVCPGCLTPFPVRANKKYCSAKCGRKVRNG